MNQEQVEVVSFDDVFAAADAQWRRAIEVVITQRAVDEYKAGIRQELQTFVDEHNLKNAEANWSDPETKLPMKHIDWFCKLAGIPPLNYGKTRCGQRR